MAKRINEEEVTTLTFHFRNDIETVQVLGPADSNLRRQHDGGVIPDQPAEPALDFNSVSVAQGFIEKSNTNPVMEMTRLISIQRTFDAISNSVAETEEGLANAIRTLGG